MSLEIIVERGERWEANRLMGIQRSPAIAICHCGKEIELSDPLDNECDNCHRWFNMSGQEVVPSHRCYGGLDGEGEPIDY